MKKYNFSGKTLEEAITTANAELNCVSEDYYYSIEETKNGLFRSKKIDIEVVKKEDIIEEIKSFLTKIIKLIGLDAKFEIKKRIDTTLITVFCENNNVLIGKRGKTINALNLILKQYLNNQLNFNYNFVLDVSDYKEKNQKRLEKLAKRIAIEVKNTKVDVKLEPMNSYERRIIHTILSDNKYVKTESVGEEPNRCVVIKYKED